MRNLNHVRGCDSGVVQRVREASLVVALGKDVFRLPGAETNYEANLTVDLGSLLQDIHHLV